MANWFETQGRFQDSLAARRVALFYEILGRFKPGRLADLGAGHGTFSRAAADLGWEVTAFDARAERFQSDTRVSWVTQDIRDIDLSPFDLVLCLGLWYHLTLDDQESLLRRCAPRPLMIDTHFALEDDKAHGAHLPRLSEIVDVGGLRGRWYDESDVQDQATASFGNPLSFWPTERSLDRQIAAAGYDMVEAFSPVVSADRRFFLARALDGAERRELDARVARYVKVSDPTPPPWAATGKN